ncbi:hypothetical protein KM043_002880 [Ampulex compressa]|nr:hypothetical protein KM043_002880 [Ampulex compressa]
MPSLRTFRIEFERAGATYTPGEEVSGFILVDVVKQKNVRGLNITVKGEASVDWTTSKTEKDSRGHSHTRTEHYRSSERYFTFSYPLLSAHGNSSISIPIGQHKYSFKFQLPNNIPCSFEHELGHVRYTLKAVINRPWKFDHECKAAFTVISSLDLNLRRQQCGSLDVHVRVPSTGYVPGQTIVTMVNLNNRSTSVEVTKICTKLKRNIKFHASTPHRSERSVNTEVCVNKIRGPFSHQNTVDSHLLIPPVPPSGLEYCQIIDLKYTLNVYVHVSGMHCKIERIYPLLIGTMPLRAVPSTSMVQEYPPSLYSRPTAPLVEHVENEQVPMPMPMAVHVPMPMPMPMPISVDAPMQMPMPVPMTVPQATSSPPIAPYPCDPPPTGGYPGAQRTVGFVVSNQPTTSFEQFDTPPPTYEECMSGTRNIREHDESNYVHGANEPFVPRYPVFNYPLPSHPGK